MRRTKAEIPPKAEAAPGEEFNCVTFRVVWNEPRRGYEVHGNDGQIHAFSADKQEMIDVAERKARRAGKLGMEGIVSVQQEDNSFKIKRSS